MFHCDKVKRCRKETQAIYLYIMQYLKLDSQDTVPDNEVRARSSADTLIWCDFWFRFNYLSVCSVRMLKATIRAQIKEVTDLLRG